MTAKTECPYTVQLAAPFLPESCPFPWGIGTMHGSLGPPESTAQSGTSRLVDPRIALLFSRTRVALGGQKYPKFK